MVEVLPLQPDHKSRHPVRRRVLFLFTVGFCNGHPYRALEPRSTSLVPIPTTDRERARHDHDDDGVVDRRGPWATTSYR